MCFACACFFSLFSFHFITLSFTIVRIRLLCRHHRISICIWDTHINSLQLIAFRSCYLNNLSLFVPLFLIFKSTHCAFFPVNSPSLLPYNYAKEPISFVHCDSRDKDIQQRIVQTSFKPVEADKLNMNVSVCVFIVLKK